MDKPDRDCFRFLQHKGTCLLVHHKKILKLMGTLSGEATLEICTYYISKFSLSSLIFKSLIFKILSQNYIRLLSQNFELLGQNFELNYIINENLPGSNTLLYKFNSNGYYPNSLFHEISLALLY